MADRREVEGREAVCAACPHGAEDTGCRRQVGGNKREGQCAKASQGATRWKSWLYFKLTVASLNKTNGVNERQK